MNSRPTRGPGRTTPLPVLIGPVLPRGQTSLGEFTRPGFHSVSASLGIVRMLFHRSDEDRRQTSCAHPNCPDMLIAYITDCATSPVMKDAVVFHKVETLNKRELEKAVKYLCQVDTKFHQFWWKINLSILEKYKAAECREIKIRRFCSGELCHF